MTSTTDPLAPRKGKLGTFAGVFTPSILTILGIILFLRLGFVVGNAGLVKAFVIIGIASSISILTSLSLAAIATNLQVKGGGDYYLISRTLGVGFGGAIGIVLFLAQSVSIAFYAIGFGEAISAIAGWEGQTSVQVVAAVAVSGLFVLAWMGADWASRFQYVVMGLLLLALVSFFSGAIGGFDFGILRRSLSTPAGAEPFWIVFAIFFPAITGFTQGVSMSGDLKDPAKSLPRGTFAAVGISTVVYFAVALLFAASVPLDVLSSDNRAMGGVARIGWLIDAGVVAATLSSAMASFLGAPRILQSLAADKIFRILTPFAKGSGPANNPRRGVVLSLIIAFLIIGIGNLNLIAPIVSMFFLVSYGLLNYATYYETRAASPSFRPRFRYFNKYTSLAGFLACLAAILAINVTAGAVAIGVLFGLYQYIKHSPGVERWADSSRSYLFQRTRENLQAMAREIEHPRDWRPQILAFSDDPPRRKRLLRFAGWMEGGSGLAAAVKIMEGEGALMRRRRAEEEAVLAAEIQEAGVEAYPLVVLAPDAAIAGRTVVQSFGVGPLKANTVLVNWLEVEASSDPDHRAAYATMLRDTVRSGLNVVALSAPNGAWARTRAEGDSKRIDVWWFDDQSSRLMLLLAYLFTRTPLWADATIRVLAPNGNEETSLEDLEQWLEEIRITATPVLVPEAGRQAVAQHSAGADVVFLPMRLHLQEALDPFGEGMYELVRQLPVTALVIAAQDVELDSEPESGILGQLSEARDAADEAAAKARAARKDADRAEDTVARLRRELAADNGEDAEEGRKILAEAEAVADSARRRAARAQAKADSARASADRLQAGLAAVADEASE